MRPREKDLLSNILGMSAVAWFVHTFVEVPLHEYGHYWVATLLGAPVYIDGERTIWATSEIVPPETRTIVFLSGGLIAGSLLLVLYVFMATPYRYGLLPLVVANFAYAPLDATVAGSALGLLAMAIVWVIIVSVPLARFMGGTEPSGDAQALTKRRWTVLRIPGRLATSAKA